MLPRVFCLVARSNDLTVLPELREAGVEGFQVRDKQLTARELLALTCEVLRLVPDSTVIVNDHVDVALAAGAHGVHLGAEDLPVAAGRRLAPDLLIGSTCRCRADVERAADDGADYAGFGPVFSTSSKDGLPEPSGGSAVTEAAGILPLIAIAGITAANAAAVIRAGAHGVAVIGGIWRHQDPVGAARALVASVEGAA